MGRQYAPFFAIDSRELALRVGETAEPIPADDEILIDVHAASERRHSGQIAQASRIGCDGAGVRDGPAASARSIGTETMLPGITMLTKASKPV